MSINSYEEVRLTEELLKIDKWAEMVKYARTGVKHPDGYKNCKTFQKPNIAACGYHGWYD